VKRKSVPKLLPAITDYPEFKYLRDKTGHPSGQPAKSYQAQIRVSGQ
jgi:hypothetical protein